MTEIMIVCGDLIVCSIHRQFSWTRVKNLKSDYLQALPGVRSASSCCAPAKPPFQKSCPCCGTCAARLAARHPGPQQRPLLIRGHYCMEGEEMIVFFLCSAKHKNGPSKGQTAH